MELSNERLVLALEEAIKVVVEHDRHLLEVDVNERSITHRLAMYLQKALPECDVDAEYNRDQAKPKRLDIYREEKVQVESMVVTMI